MIVPCGHGDFLVRELMEKAITRFKKASSKVRGERDLPAYLPSK